MTRFVCMWDLLAGDEGDEPSKGADQERVTAQQDGEPDQPLKLVGHISNGIVPTSTPCLFTCPLNLSTLPES